MSKLLWKNWEEMLSTKLQNDEYHSGIPIIFQVFSARSNFLGIATNGSNGKHATAGLIICVFCMHSMHSRNSNFLSMDFTFFFSWCTLSSPQFLWYEFVWYILRRLNHKIFHKISYFCAKQIFRRSFFLFLTVNHIFQHRLWWTFRKT